MSGKKGCSMVGLLWIVVMVFFMQVLDVIIFNIVFLVIVYSFNCFFLVMQLVIISYMLMVVMLILVSGWLVDCFGMCWVFIIVVSLFIFGFFVCVFFSFLMELVIFCVIQGIGGVMMMLVVRLVLLCVYFCSELLLVLNFVIMLGLVGLILGLVFGGVFVIWVSWYWIFLINILIGVIGILYVCKYMLNFIMLC